MKRNYTSIKKTSKNNDLKIRKIKKRGFRVTVLKIKKRVFSKTKRATDRCVNTGKELQERTNQLSNTTRG